MGKIRAEYSVPSASVKSVAGGVEQHRIAMRDMIKGMSGPLDEFFAGVEEEFDVDFADREDALFRTPGEVIDFVADQTSPADGMDSQEHRDHVAAVIGEIMAQTLGITRYQEDSRFLQDLHRR
jgi:hypothetical protein